MNGIIILAAGESRRMGQPKQLLEIENENLLDRMIRIAKESKFEMISVVLGAHMEKILPEVNTSGINIFYNPEWESGMASSLKCGLKHSLKSQPDLQFVLILLVDQPFVKTSLINNFFELHVEKKKPLIAAKYNDIYGVPALFGKELFPQILQQKGQGGARKLIKAHEKDLLSIEFPEGARDLDTPEDWEKFKQ